ncbi:MAG: class I SAM-dependent methyltransferase [Planctomycetes bacterium]|nr:class I SAM-dependent methyltransferase [Planctomycetota bacterium]
MSRARRSAVQKYHDRVAPRYDDSYGDTFWQWHDALTWDYLKPHLPVDSNAEVVDLGCGTGKWAAKLHKSGYPVTCVDISARMVDQARTKLDQHRGVSRTTFVQADLSDLSALPAGRFALAIALGEPIGFTESPRRALLEIKRILKPNGLLVATLDNRLAGIDFLLSKGDPDAMTRYLKAGNTHWLTHKREEQFPIATFGPAEAVKLFESAGFDVLEVIGKTVLPMRKHRELLDTSDSRRRWAKIEKRLCRDATAVGLAPHLQLTGRATST